MDFDLKLQFFATTTFLGGGSLIVTLYYRCKFKSFMATNIFQPNAEILDQPMILFQSLDALVNENH